MRATNRNLLLVVVGLTVLASVVTLVIFAGGRGTRARLIALEQELEELSVTTADRELTLLSEIARRRAASEQLAREVSELRDSLEALQRSVARRGGNEFVGPPAPGASPSAEAPPSGSQTPFHPWR